MDAGAGAVVEAEPDLDAGAELAGEEAAQQARFGEPTAGRVLERGPALREGVEGRREIAATTSTPRRSRSKFDANG